jgi:hypothetical protein
MPNSRKSTSSSRLPQPKPAPQRQQQHQHQQQQQQQQQLNESGGGSDDSCCSAENMDILEACIASAMPSKPSKLSMSSQPADQPAKLQQQRLSLGEL